MVDYSQPNGPIESRRKGIQKRQAVFSLDFDTWRDLIDVFGIKESMIPHREEPGKTNRKGGWYG